MPKLAPIATKIAAFIRSGWSTAGTIPLADNGQSNFAVMRNAARFFNDVVAHDPRPEGAHEAGF